MELARITVRTAIVLIAPVTERAQLWAFMIGDMGLVSRTDRACPPDSSVPSG